MAGENEKSFLHVNKPEIDFPDDVDMYSEKVYEKGRDNLKMFIEKGWLKEDSAARIYIYKLEWKGHIQFGIICESSVEDYEKEIIKKHEKTLDKKVNDRTKMTDIQNANIGPVFLTYKNREEIDKRVAEVVAKEAPYIQVDCEDEVKHTLWLVPPEDSDFIVDQFGQVPATYIADGHHRAQSAFNVGKIKREKAKAEGINITGEEDFNYFMTLVIPDASLKILDYNRVLKTINDMPHPDFIAQIKQRYDLEEIKEGDDITPKAKYEQSFYIDKKWHKMRIHKELVDVNNPVNSLDVQTLTDNVLDPILGIKNLKTDNRIDFVGGIRGLKEIEKRCEEDCVCGFAMHPVKIDEVLAVADNKMIMPPKSTWVEPKPRSGLVVRCFHNQADITWL
eukprot:TRINITY_DN34285_c0_g1_i1.p1 TRINITY_DN34285_c0_g1~~TRINITY_DN34285_c0_g1_i1.p1  ORF type:complete len:441 (-),score=87.85 TRINITY_DN34285_c0_g1_i1:25-1200(-)